MAGKEAQGICSTSPGTDYRRSLTTTTTITNCKRDKKKMKNSHRRQSFGPEDYFDSRVSRRYLELTNQLTNADYEEFEDVGLNSENEEYDLSRSTGGRKRASRPTAVHWQSYDWFFNCLDCNKNGILVAFTTLAVFLMLVTQVYAETQVTAAIVQEDGFNGALQHISPTTVTDAEPPDDTQDSKSKVRLLPQIQI